MNGCVVSDGWCGLLRVSRSSVNFTGIIAHGWNWHVSSFHGRPRVSMSAVEWCVYA
jgi:hypothetical protein